MRAHSTRNNNQLLHCDQTRCKEMFLLGRPRMLTRDLFAVAKLLVLFEAHRERSDRPVMSWAFQVPVKWSLYLGGRPTSSAQIITSPKLHRRLSIVCCKILVFVLLKFTKRSAITERQTLNVTNMKILQYACKRRGANSAPVTDQNT